MTGTIEDRQLGVYFGDVGEALENHEYPATAAELSAAYGDERIEIELANTTVPLSELFDPIEETFQTSEDVLATMLMMVGMDAVGRKRYTDRGGSPGIEQEIGPNYSL